MTFGGQDVQEISKPKYIRPGIHEVTIKSVKGELNANGNPITPPLKSKVAFILIAPPVVVVIMLELINTEPAVTELTFKLAPPPPIWLAI